MRKTIIAVLGICFAAFFALSVNTHSPALAQSATVTPAPSATSVTCQDIVSRALDVLQNTCNSLVRNSACYGNDSIQAKLTGAGFSFQHPGDKVPIKVIKTVTTSALNQGTGTWGLSLFKLQANLPDTLPGQNVTFLVFGDTSIQNVSGDMRAFYFSTGLGAPTCGAVPDDSILVRSPDHEQVTFTANGVKITIASTVVLKAVPNQSMSVQLIEGHATVSTPQGSRVLQPSQSVSIAMGGASGLEPLGVPSPATTASLNTTTLNMVSSLNTLTGSSASIPIKGCITAIDGSSITIGDVRVAVNSDDLASQNLAVGDCLTVDTDVTSHGSGTLVITPTPGTTLLKSTDDSGHNGSGDDNGHGNGKGNNGNGNGNGGGNGSNGGGNGKGNNGNGNGNGGGNGSNGGGNGNGNNGNGGGGGGKKG